MSLNIGGSASKTKTKSTSTLNSTTTPIVPEWANSLTQNVAGRVGGLMNLDSGSQVAPEHALQRQAAQRAAGLTGEGWLQPFLQTATPFASGGKAYDYVGRYLNPYLSEVVDSSAADLDANAGQVRAQQDLDLAGSGAFGGSGAALTRSMTEGELSRARASSLSGLRSQAYQSALGAASGDADRATQARIANAQTALQDAAQKVNWDMQAINTLGQLGGTLRGVDQEQRRAPVTSTQQIVAMLQGLPISLFTGEQKNQTENKVGVEKTIGANFSASSPPTK
jgi:hypothetical protein